MKFLIVFVALFAFALAAPPHFAQHSQPEVQIVRFDSDVKPEGYAYAYETSDGTSANEQGQLKDVGAEEPAIVVRGSFSFVADDGQVYTVNYIADENGFQPQGAHLPVA